MIIVQIAKDVEFQPILNVEFVKTPQIGGNA